MKEGDGNLGGAGAQLLARCERPFLPSTLLPGRAMSESARRQATRELGYAVGGGSLQDTKRGRKQVRTMEKNWQKRPINNHSELFPLLGVEPGTD